MTAPLHHPEWHNEEYNEEHNEIGLALPWPVDVHDDRAAERGPRRWNRKSLPER